MDVSNHSVNAQKTNYVRESISSVRSSEIKAMIQLKLNMLVLIPSFAILDRRIAVNGRETCDRIMSLQNTSNRVHLAILSEYNNPYISSSDCLCNTQYSVCSC